MVKLDKNNIVKHLEEKPYVFKSYNWAHRLFFTAMNASQFNEYDNNKIDSFVYLVDLETNNFITQDEIESYAEKNFGFLKNMSSDVLSIKMNPKFKLVTIYFDEKDRYMVVSYCAPTRVSNQTGTIHFQYEYKDKRTHLVFLNDGAVKFQSKKGKYYDLPISSSIDGCGKIVDDLVEFQLVNDFKNESGGLKVNFKGELTYTFVNLHSNRLSVLMDKYKSLDVLRTYFNVNKLKYWEIGIFRELRLKLTELEFKRVLNWYRQDGRNYYYEYWTHKDNEMGHYEKPSWRNLYAVYLSYLFNVPIFRDRSVIKIGSIFTHEHMIIEDYIRSHHALFKYKKNKFQIDFSSWKRFCQEEHRLSIELQNYYYKQYYKSEFNKSAEWKPLLNRLSTCDLDVTHLNKGRMLIEEGNRQCNCVGSYIERVYRNRCLILSYRYKNRNYTVEIVNIGTKRKPVYDIRQCSGKYNSSASNGAVEALSAVIN